MSDATCMVGGDVRVDTIGIMHVLHEVENERLRLVFVRENERMVREFGPAARRDVVSMKQCEACSRVFVSMRDDFGQDLLMERDPADGGSLDKNPDAADRA